MEVCKGLPFEESFRDRFEVGQVPTLSGQEEGETTSYLIWLLTLQSETVQD